jgi:ABC-type branched-subunit amino acid transport system ATPase component
VSGPAVLRLAGVSKAFGGLRAVRNLSFEVPPDAVIGIIGPNGAGKTTVFNLISGLYPFEGRIELFGRPVAGIPAHRLTAMGLARTFQTPRIFRELTVLENVLLGFHVRTRAGVWRSLLRDPATVREAREMEGEGRRLLARVGLEAKADRPASGLTYGELRRLEIGRALASRPRLLLLDEPLAGLGWDERAKVLEIIREIRGRGLTVLLIEHNVSEVMGLSDRVVVLHFGEKIAEGSPDAVRRDRRVIEAYLGEERDAAPPPALAARPGPLLAVEGIAVGYGPVQALQDVSLSVGEGEIVALLGANGAGKTTTLKTISGLMHPARGRITFRGARIDRLRPSRVAHLGIAHVPEGRQLFPTLTVRENLEMGAYVVRDPGVVDRGIARVEALFPILKERKHQLAGTLSGGEQQMAAVGRALMANPGLLLMDEPSMGLAPRIIEEIFAAIQELNRQGLSILLVEQNARLALEVAHRGAVLETGRIVVSGDGAVLRDDPRVKEAYLGA